MARYDLNLNKEIVTVGGIQIGPNACQMIDVNIDPITHLARLDYSFVSPEIERKPGSVFTKQFMKNTDCINQQHNKKYAASRKGLDATRQIFGRNAINPALILGEPVATTTISYQFFIDPKTPINLIEYDNPKIFITPTYGKLDTIVDFKTADKLQSTIDQENNKSYPMQYDNSLESKLKLIGRFFRATGPDPVNPRKFFQDVTKNAGKLAHEFTHDIIFDKEIQVVTQLDKAAFKELRKSQKENEIDTGKQKDYSKKINYCSTDKAFDIIMAQSGVEAGFFKVGMLAQDQGMAIYNAAIFRQFLITGQTDILSIEVCDRLGEIQDFQSKQGIRPAHMKPAKMHLRPLKAA